MISETRLGKNRVSTARNPVGEKPGFDRWGKTGFQWGQKPGWQKTGFRPLAKNRVSVGPETRLGKNRVLVGPETRLGKNRVSTVGKKTGFLL
jgi:hypothetical protein